MFRNLRTQLAVSIIAALILMLLFFVFEIVLIRRLP